MSEYPQAEIRKMMRKAVAYYLIDAPERTWLMDELAQVCTERQWEHLTAMLEEADEFRADSDIGLLAQKERVMARREKRQDRSPTSLDDDVTRTRKLAIIREDFRKRGIKFTDHE